MKGQRSVPIEIAGRVYHIKTKDDDSYAQKLAKIVNDRIREVTEATGIVDSLKVVDMASLNLADTYYRMKEEYEDRIASLEAEKSRLRELIENALNKNDSLPDA